MKKIIAAISGISFLLIISCGPSAEEKARAEQHIADSVKAFMQDQANIKDSIKVQQEGLDYTEMRLSEVKAELEVQRTKLSDAKQFVFLRSASEKEEQIRNISLEIDRLEKNLATLYSNKDIYEKNIAFYQGQISGIN